MPLRFSILTIQDKPWPTLLRQWQLIETLGYDTAYIADHFGNLPGSASPWFDAWTLLPALAVHTTRLRIGTLVTNFIYRNPALIAQQAQTLDHISGGRLELGIGATDSSDTSHAMTGVEVWPNPERVARFREVVAIIDQMLRQPVTTYHGAYYRVDGAETRPPTVQIPRPPITIAAHGKATLRIAARYADRWNTYGAWRAPHAEALATLRANIDLLDRFAQEAGRNPRDIARSFLVGLTDAAPFASLAAFHDYIGPLIELGIDEFIFYYDYHRLPPERCLTRDMLERLASDVLPALRAQG